MKLFYNSTFDKLKGARGVTGNLLWEKTTMPLGNGSIGMSVYGGIKKERIVINEKTLWSGGPSAKRNYNGGNLEKGENGKTSFENFTEIRRLFSEGRDSEASKLCEELTGAKEGYGTYLCLGEIEITHTSVKKKAKAYSRELDLERAICTVLYQNNGEKIKRNYFVSYPDKVGVVSIETEELNDFCIGYSMTRKAIVRGDTRGIFISGEIEDNNLRFATYLAIESDGQQEYSEGKIEIKNAKRVLCVLSATTDYMDNFPIYRSGETLSVLENKVAALCRAAIEKGYERLLKAHTDDYGALFGRVKLSLGGKHELPTDIAVKKYRRKTSSQEQKRSLEELLYQYGRYLTIASSRQTDILPSNLQGIWNNCDNPMWSSDFHLNVNLQMNYWQVYNGNLHECALPLLRYIDALRKPGRETARIYTGVKSEEGEENGYLFHTQNTPFGWTCPGWEFSWGWSPAAVSWILHNVYEYYEYTQDKKVLKDVIYPMLKEASVYLKNLLIDDGKRLVSSPCFSPEHGPRTQGNTYEQSLNYQLFKDTQNAAYALGIDRIFCKELQEVLDRLHPIETGEDGQIKEWYHETKLGKIGQTKHRHLSHLLGIYPCSVIDKFNNAQEFAAATISLNRRGDKSTGWAKAQRINTWARLGEGDRALKLIYDLIAQSINPNLWDEHPPFQIDGNFGYTAGVNEMLMQSNAGCIELLPALPKEWKNGSIKGIVARGNFTLDIEWQNGLLSECTIYANAGGKLNLRCPQGQVTADMPFKTESGYISLSCKEGDKITLKLI